MQHAVFLAAALAFSSAAAADYLPGRDDPLLEMAASAWLDGDDAGSLPVLAELARDGNTAAQILLDRIRTRGHSVTPWLTALSPTEQKAMFRRMDTPLGTTWMRVAAQTSPLAQTFIAYLQPGPGGYSAAIGLELAGMGEPRAAAELLPIMLTHGQWAETVRLAPVAESSGLAPLAWAAASHAPEVPGAAVLRQSGLMAVAAGTMEGYVFLAYADPSDGGVAGVSAPDQAFRRHAVYGTRPVVGMGPPSPEAGAFLDRWLSDAQAAAPLRRYCAEYCAEAVSACAEDVWGAIGGYVPFMLLQGSPLEGVITTDRYVKSHRASLAVDAAIATPFREADGTWYPRVAFEGCLMAHLRGG